MFLCIVVHCNLFQSTAVHCCASQCLCSDCQNHFAGGGNVTGAASVKLSADSDGISTCLLPVAAPPMKPAPAPTRAPMAAPLPPPATPPINAPPAAPPPVVAAVLLPLPFVVLLSTPVSIA